MTPPTPNDRVLGLSPKARRIVLPAVALAVVVVLVGSFARRGSQDPTNGGRPYVGADLHSVAALGNRVFVGGHGGAGLRKPGGLWTQIASLNDKDVMSWAQSDSAVLAGGHSGLYRSGDSGSTVGRVPGMPVSDVHALGASGQRVYLGSPEAGILVSNNGGKSFTKISDSGRDFMGSIWVDPADDNVAVAPSMQSGAERTTDGGKTWTLLGPSSGSMSVAVDSKGRRFVAIGMNGIELSTDAGRTWSPASAPLGTAAAAYTAQGRLLAAVLNGDRAEVYESVEGKWQPLTR
jgi:hypothetical protein